MYYILLSCGLNLALLSLFFLMRRGQSETAKVTEIMSLQKFVNPKPATKKDKRPNRRANRQLRRAIMKRYGLEVPFYVSAAEYDALVDMVAANE
jgi:hypothetical protein